MQLEWMATSVLLAVGSIAASGCFDSDQKFAAGTTGDGTTGTTETTMVPTTTSSTSTTEVGSSTTETDVTCRDAIDCILGCAAAIPGQGNEPDLSCFLECEERLTVPEAVKLLELANCASEQCEMSGDCASGTSSSTGGGSSSTTSGGDEGDDGAIPPCLTCIFGLVQDPAPPGCEEFASACE